MGYDDLKAGLRKRLGVTDANLSDDDLLAAVDEALEETADPTQNAALPPGTVAIDSTVLEQLQANAQAGALARAEQDNARRDGIVDEAMREGRITASSRDTWRAQLDLNEEATAALLGTLAKNTVPVKELGHSDSLTSADDALLAAAGWDDTEKED